MKSATLPNRSEDRAARAAHELVQLEKQTLKARLLLARLQRDLVDAGNTLGSEATLLIEANQQLVLSAMHAQIRAEMIERSAEHDALTSLPNRILLLDRFTQAIVVAKRRDSCLALLFLDINDFKHINDSLGHGVGDQVLKHVAHCLTAVVRQADTVSRHGGDEFLILLAEMAQLSDAILIADKIHASLSAPHRIGDQVLSLKVSIGISLYPDHCEEPSELIECADRAMYHAKRNGLNSCVYRDDNIARENITESTESASAMASLEVENHLEGKNPLLEVNEQLVIATLNAQADVEIANITLAKAEQSIELEVVTRASRGKSEFLSRVSHELRTPLNAILGFSHLMLMDNESCSYHDVTQHERLVAIELAGQQLLSLTNDMLDIARIEHGRAHIDMQVVDVYTLIRSAKILLEPSALEYQVEIHDLSRKDEYRVMADELALGQILLNLMSNAIKYNRPGGWVKVETLMQLDELLIVVEDNGLGMSPAQLANLFQPFNRLGAEQSAMPGNGLGMVISKDLVELMGGTLNVNSVEGSGTKMEIHLCHSIAALLPTVSSSVASSLATSSSDSSFLENGQPIVSVSPLAAPITAARTVLYVEDNPVNAMIMKQLFAAEPAWSLSIAATGQIGIELAASLRPSLVILDMQLPDMTGTQVFLALQAQNLLPPKGCIALSADAMPEQIATALQAGFSEYWTKPINIRITLTSLREILKADPS